VVAAKGRQMRSGQMTRRALVLLGVLGVALAAAGVAGAETPPARVARLSYFTESERTGSLLVWGANADGSDRVRLATGADQAKLSPDGERVALTKSDASGAGTWLVITSSAVPGPARTALATQRLLHTKGSLDLLAWAADGSEVAVQAGDWLVVVDVFSGAKHRIARGFVNSASFSPSGRQLVYARGGGITTTYALASSLAWGPSCSNLFIADADGSHRRALTHDGLASSPLWGPAQIAFSRTARCSRFGGGGLFPSQLWLMRPDGRGSRQLTHVHVKQESLGLSAIAWSDDGRRLLAEHHTPSGSGFVAPTDGAWTVEVPSGRARRVGVRGHVAIGGGLSHDGSTVLATLEAVNALGTGDTVAFPAHPPRLAIVAIPWHGGRPHVLVRNAFDPSWSN
jgi:hypothetical protein